MTLFATDAAIAEGDGGGSGSGGAGDGSSGAGAGGAGAGASGGGGFNAPTQYFSDVPADPVGSNARAAQRAEARGEAKSLAKMLRFLARIAPGRVLSVVFEKSRYGYDYAFSVLTEDGRYVDVVLDARTGNLISARTR